MGDFATPLLLSLGGPIEALFCSNTCGIEMASC